jgi:hypothetical protein
MNDFEMEEYELLKLIEVLIEHVQELTIELASVLCDVYLYLHEFEGSYDPLLDEDYAGYTDSGFNDDDEYPDLPALYSRKELIQL